MPSLDDLGPNAVPPPEGAYSDAFDTPIESPPTTYADAGFVKNLLSYTQTLYKNLVSDLESNISPLSLAVTNAPADQDLMKAVAESWPTSMGSVPNYVSYGYYKYLETQDTRSANYIRDKYEEAARGVTGSNSIDLLPLANIIVQELTLAQEFLNTYVGTLSDSAEHRAVENIQDWAQSTIFHEGRIRSIIKKTNADYQLPGSDVDSASPKEVHDAQALFIINLNRLNRELVYNISFLKKEFADHASTFYHNYLGPAINFRVNVTSKISSPPPGLMGREVIASQLSANKNLQIILADQVRRLQLFDNKMQETQVNLQMRDYYRGYIIQLQQKGRMTTPGTSGTLITGSANLDHETAFALLAAQPSATPSFDAPHSALAGVDDAQAHPQYVLSAGDQLTGNLTIADGVTIDRIVPHTHAHSGVDGSARIQGSDIIGGTLGSGSVDTSQTPMIPTLVHILNQSLRIAPPGQRVVDVTIGWEGNDGNTFEVQIAAVTQ